MPLISNVRRREHSSLKFESLGQYHDAWAGIVLFAPNEFTDLDGNPIADQSAALEEAFQTIHDGFGLVERKIKDQRLLAILRELLVMSLESYRAGERKRGAHVFQECEGLIWPSRAGQLKYAVEAEERAFGKVERFKDVVVSPYPMEGTSADLGPTQGQLLEYAQAQAHRYIETKDSFQSLIWAMNVDRSITEIKKRSRKATVEHLREAAMSGNILGSVFASFPFGGFKGLLAFNLEEVGYPRVEAIALVEDWKLGLMRYRLHEPEIFRPSAGAA